VQDPNEIEAQHLSELAQLRHRVAELQTLEIKRQQTEEALQQRSHDLTQLYQASQALAATLDLYQVMQRVLQHVTELVGAQGCSVWLWNEEHADELICQAVFHPGLQHQPPNWRLPAGQGVVGWVAQTGQTARVTRTSQDPRFYPGIDTQTGFHTLSLLAVPLRAHDAVIGTMEAVNKLKGEFDEHDQALLETLANAAATAIDNARLVEALRRSNAELEARNQDLDAFAHTVAHDLKNPMGLIIGFAELLQLGPDDLPENEWQHAAQTIGRSARKINNIIDELLLLAEVRKVDVRTVPLDMASVVAEARRRLSDMIERHKAEIILPPAWPPALGYAPWIEEVWANYMSNAIKYGGQPPRVELGATLASPDGRIRFWVCDNGPGIAPEDLAGLFTPFTRLDQVRAGGHGLGLSIVRRIVEKLGGQVGVESRVDQGSVFYFTLPGVMDKGK
jgi:signal transduction histidine kinase